MPDSLLNNLVAASVQMFLIAMVGTCLPVLLRIRHPRTHLIYCHLLLVACILVPWVQPWLHPIVEITNVSLPGPNVLLWILCAGVVTMLGCLLIGLSRIRSYRIQATPLHPVPTAIQAAEAITHASALFCVSTEVTGPVTADWLNPVILLPQSFATLEEEAQCGIACHELLHVRRHDWAVTLLEEITRAVLWFNPGIWLLLSQTRLVREQLVDAEVVRLTAAKDSYIDALLSMARCRPALDLGPAPLFLRRRHLTQRMHALLKDTPMSKPRLISSYGFSTAALSAAAWLAMGAFPLVGDPQLQPGAVGQQKSRFVKVPTESTAPPTITQEPVIGPVNIPGTPTDRAAALYLLERAKQNSKLHLRDSPPFALRAVFQSWGSGRVQFTGPGEMTELWQSGQKWMWTAKLGFYSQTRFRMGAMTGDKEPVPIIPMRVQMLRAAIFWAARPTPANAQIRTAEAQSNGRAMTCLLFSGTAIAGPVKQRRWEEEEYCVDPVSGLLQVYSLAPGSYAHYSYAKGRQLHGRPEPDGITLYEGGAQVLDAQLEFTDLGDTNPTQAFQISAHHPAVILEPSRRQMVVLASNPGQTPNRRAVVHATLDASGRVIEAEITSADDSAVAQTAMELVAKGTFRSRVTNTLTQGEAYLDVQVVE